MSRTEIQILGMRLSIRPLMPRPKPASRLHLRPERWILDTLKVNDPPKKRARTPGTSKRISFSRIFLLMRHQVGPNSYRHIPRKTRTVVFAKKNPNNKAKAKILLPLVSTLPLSRRTRPRIRTKKTYQILSTTFVSKRVIMPTSVLRRSQKTSVGLDDLHLGD